MKEITFLKQNADKWEKIENGMVNGSITNPREISEIYIELTNDLSYSRTYYPESQTTAYLNGLTARLHQSIYKNKKEERGRIKRFWAKEIPALFGNYHKQLFIAFLIFSVSAIIGFVSQVYNDDFVRLIIGDDYVNETMERIKNGNPLGIYGETAEGPMFIVITVNNIKVSFYAFIMGLIFSLGTAYILFSNGLMLGAFQAMFYNHSLFIKSILVVYIHGTLEISAIIIAGCAGFVLGNSFMFPGTYTRIESFKRGAMDSLKIVVGLVPIFIMAGFLESFVTRYTNMPLWLSLLIILSSLSFIVWYFIFLPIKVTKKNKYVPTSLAQN